MKEAKLTLKEEQKKALEAAMRPRLDFSAWRDAAAKKEAAEIVEAEARAILNAVPGQMIEGQGIYLGQYEPKGLGKIFNVFAAPEDLPEPMKYAETVEYIAEMKNWHGHDGANYASDKEIFSALKDGSYNGGWIIPTYELLAGTDPKLLKYTHSSNLFDHRNTGSFKGTFTMVASSRPYLPEQYWSSAEDPEDTANVCLVDFSTGRLDVIDKDVTGLSCRPVRLVERKPHA